MKILDNKSFNSAIKQGPILVDFYADWCGPCKMLSPILSDLSNDEEYKGKLEFGKLNTEHFPELAEENNVQGIPCLIMFKNNKEVNRIVGFAPKAVMKAKINSLLDTMQ